MTLGIGNFYNSIRQYQKPHDRCFSQSVADADSFGKLQNPYDRCIPKCLRFVVVVESHRKLNNRWMSKFLGFVVLVESHQDHHERCISNLRATWWFLAFVEMRQNLQDRYVFIMCTPDAMCCASR